MRVAALETAAESALLIAASTALTRRRGLAALKKKNGGKFPTHAKKVAPVAAATKAPRCASKGHVQRGHELEHERGRGVHEAKSGGGMEKPDGVGGQGSVADA
eukprot:353522-Chlamydomonas_euryale.AAC.8